MLLMWKFDAIFGMDWRCDNEFDRLPEESLSLTKENVMIAFLGKGTDGSCLISYQCIKRLIKWGCEVFLDIVVASAE